MSRGFIRLGRALLWAGAVLLLAIAVNLAGIHFLGGIDAWAGWMAANAKVFFVWRLLLYAGLARGWWWMRGRLLAREPGADVRRRLRRVEIAAALAFIALEASRFPQS
ncbi:MAG: hypothetical protein LBE06_05200 [Azoarcus sp.]|jgi:hypothetical protein|nr:hypothetical protein [Azoarcus sp.]